MRNRSEKTQPADEGRLDQRVRAHDPERAAFEAWAAKRWGTDAYRHTSATSGEWEAWRAARPPRHEIGRLVNLAADCAQRKPLTSLAPLTVASHIGHRQFGIAYAGADEAMRQLAIELRRVADAL